MSIINEALKKTDAGLKQHETQMAEEPAQKIKPKLLLIYLLILIVSIFLSKFIFDFLGRKPAGSGLASLSQSRKPAGSGLASLSQSRKPAGNKPAPLTQETAKTTQATTAAIESSAAKPILQEEKPTFVLNGIFVSGNEAYAIVNNQIVRENELIDGAQVKKITARNVEINYKGETIGLSTGR